MALTLISFGYLHGDPPQADRVEDVRQRLRDPAAARDILDLDGHHPRVQQIVENTAGARDLLDNLVDYILTCYPTRVALGCGGGRHRGPGLAALLAERLRHEGYPVEVEHRDIHRPRVLNPEKGK